MHLRQIWLDSTKTLWIRSCGRHNGPARCYCTAKVSSRVSATEEPVIVKTKQLMAGADNVISLAQGVVHWKPPDKALEMAAQGIKDKATSAYGPCEGLPELVTALEAKLAAENHLPDHRVMCTAGANQAFVNLVLTLLDDDDKAVLFSPYYFNHLMAIQMTGGTKGVVLGQCDPLNLRPDLSWLAKELKKPNPPKMVVLVNPCNPTGVLLTREELETASKLCKQAGAWLIMDNTYEHFVYDGRPHVCLAADHIIHIFSFSKAFGMMGWRVGYLAYRDQDGSLSEQLRKVQDTIPICPPQLSMQVALQAIKQGRSWVTSRIQGILQNKEMLLDALSPLGQPGQGVTSGEGAIYLFAKLPEGKDEDIAVVEYLIKAHGVCVIPGSSCGAPGYIRVAFGNLEAHACKTAAAKLKAGLEQLVQSGLP